MKALLALLAVAGTAYVGYSYNSTDGASCLVCPMTGEAIFASTETETESSGCCSRGAETMLTGIEGETSSCCSQSKPACCPDSEAALLTSTGTSEGTPCCSKGDAALLTSVDAAECNSKKGCCEDKEAVVEVAAGEDTVVAEGDAAVVAEVAAEVVAEVAETE